ncbi:hypothetical protein LV89_01814 [Arcicella aurantiaca]|uniref:Uncharacterized protein n=1 Tax=Arcicella aurantiaca TaxID=591202 RepID=A0A316EA65_9BACT|nr:hypothetical protein [Arcicella aurantiaca]PWK27002.1 hypothetical protein LV89_01814 [Arcicella aurantiaca]
MIPEYSIVTTIVVGFVISTIVAAGYIAVQWGKGVMIRNAQVRGDAVAAFLAYFLVKIEVKKKDLYRQGITREARSAELSKINALEKQVPKFEMLKNSNFPLILESFLTAEQINYLNVAS